MDADIPKPQIGILSTCINTMLNILFNSTEITLITTGVFESLSAKNARIKRTMIACANNETPKAAKLRAVSTVSGQSNCSPPNAKRTMGTLRTTNNAEAGNTKKSI